nr:hypothetical protein [Hafnia alvei]
MNTALSPVSSQPELFPLTVMAQHGCLLPVTGSGYSWPDRSGGGMVIYHDNQYRLLESAVRYLGIEVHDALKNSESIEV